MSGATIDNDYYNREATTWRDEHHLLSLLVALTPPRVVYMRDVLERKLGLDLRDKVALDVGCGGGLVAEEMAKLGCRVTGVDPSAPSLETARRHAAEVGLDIAYRTGSGEELPCDDASFDIVYCLDVLEHVRDVDRVIAEAARVLKPGGVFIFDTINRTLASKLITVKLAQDWRWTSFFPKNFHVWAMFIKPEELVATLGRHGLRHRETVGFGMAGNPIAMLRTIRKLKRGAITYGDMGRYMAAQMATNKDLSMSYGGYAVKG